MYGSMQEANLIKAAITNIISAIPENVNVHFNMSQPGNGTYQIGETVYQGYSAATATATGKVVNWANGALELSELSGNFQTGLPIHGITTNAAYNFATYSASGPVPERFVQIAVTPNPTTANVGDPYTYTTTIQEGVGDPIVVVGGSNNSIVHVPPAPIPFNFDDLDLME